MGAVVSTTGNVVGTFYGSVLLAPFKSIFGRSCEDVCPGAWDVHCFLANLCFASLGRLLVTIIIALLVLVLVCLVLKIGIIQFVLKCGWKICWGSCSGCCRLACCLWRKVRDTKRVYRGRRGRLQNQDVELGGGNVELDEGSGDSDDGSGDSHEGSGDSHEGSGDWDDGSSSGGDTRHERSVRRDKWGSSARDRRKDKLRDSLRPRRRPSKREHDATRSPTSRRHHHRHGHRSVRFKMPSSSLRVHSLERRRSRLRARRSARKDEE